MKNFFQIFLIVLFVLSFTACNNYRELKIDNVQRYEFKGFENNKLLFNLIIPIDNQYKQNITISEIYLNAFIKNIPLGKLETNEKITIKRNCKQNYKIPVTIQITNMLGGFSLLTSPSKAIEQLKFEGSVKIRKGLFIKKIKVDKEMSQQYLKF